MFDISDYNDQELYEILDLVNPSDRILEAKILMQIHKYQLINNNSSKKLVDFFNSVYNHFFVVDDDDSTNNDDDYVEGFVNSDYPLDTLYTANIVDITLPDSSIPSINRLQLNDTVKVNFNSMGVWYDAVINSINEPDGTVDVQIFDPSSYQTSTQSVVVESGQAENPYKTTPSSQPHNLVQ